MTRGVTTSLFGRKVTLLSKGEDFSDLYVDRSNRPKDAVFCNVHMIMLAREDAQLALAMDQADLVLADGVPIAWLQGRLSGQRAAVTRGYQAMLALSLHAASHGEAIGLYGSTEEVLEKLVSRLRQWFPDLNIAYVHSPPFTAGPVRASTSELERINQSGIDYLFVALGCPKQEKWLHEHKAKLACSMLAVGAAFDWLAGVEPMVPKRLERFGFGWLYRWLHHPIGHFKRYAYYNSKFMALAFIELLKTPRK